MYYNRNHITSACPFSLDFVPKILHLLAIYLMFCISPAHRVSIHLVILQRYKIINFLVDLCKYEIWVLT